MTSPIRKLPAAAAIYATGDVLIKATNLLLLPLLTRYLTPEDYGILAGVAAFTMVLSLILQLNLGNSVMRFYGESTTEVERRDLIGTAMLFAALWAAVLVFLLNVAGQPLLDHLYKGVRFEPYLRMGTWIAFFTTLNALPLTVLQMQQRPMLYRVFSLTTSLANSGFMVLFVVGLRKGAVGGLLGQVCGTAVVTIPFLIFLRRHMSFAINWALLKVCLVFSLPLLVYAFGGWVMDMSNRLFIERYINLNQLGLFNVGNQFAMVLGFLLAAVGLAFTPLFYQTAKLDRAPSMLASFGLLYFAGTLGVALAIAVFSKEVIQLLTPEQFHGAYRVVPILTATQALNCTWHLIVNPLMLKRKTGSIMGLMLVAAALSVGCSFLLIPRYGIVGAALSPLVANGFLNAAAFVVSIRLYPVPYSYRRIAAVSAVALCAYFAADFLSSPNVLTSIALKTAVFSLYPILLLGSGIVKVEI